MFVKCVTSNGGACSSAIVTKYVRNKLTCVDHDLSLTQIHRACPARITLSTGTATEPRHGAQAGDHA